MTKLVQNDIASLTNEQSALAALNANYAANEAFSDSVLSRDGTSPNEMLADFDMNGSRILNLPPPLNALEPLRLQDLANFAASGVISTVDTAVVYVNRNVSPASTAINNAIALLPTTGGIVDARTFGATSQTISATVNVGSATKQVTLLVDARTTYNITITNGSSAFVLFNNSGIVAEGVGPQTGSITMQVGGSANIASVITNSDKTNGNYGLSVKGITINGTTTGTIATGIVWLKGLHGINNFSDFLIENIQNTTGLLLQNGTGGLGQGTINFYNVWIDGGALTGGKPVEITDVSGGGIFAGINFFGGALEHPGSGQPIVRLTGLGQLKSIGFYGIYSETSFSNNKVMIIDGAEGVTVNGWQASGVTATNGFELTNVSGGTTKSILLQNIIASSCTNSIQDTINSVNHTDTQITQFIFGATGVDITQVYVAGGQVSKQSANNVTSGGVVMAAGSISSLPGGQIAFPATQVPSANVNTLDDYEEGTFTPAFTFSTPGNLSVAYTNQVGSYTKIGRKVFVQISISTSSFTHTTASGEARITGLPFTVSGSDFVGSMFWQGITKANYTEMTAQTQTGQTYLRIIGSGSGQNVAIIATGDMPTGGTLNLNACITYHV